MSNNKHSLARRVGPAVVLSGASVLGIFVLDHAAGSNRSGSNVFAGGPNDTSVPPPTVAPTSIETFPQSTAAQPGNGQGNQGGDPNATTTPPAGSASCAGTTTAGSPTDITDWDRTFGTVTVSITKNSSGTICDVTATYDVGDRRSQRIEEYSIPRLNAWATESNGTTVHVISGATAICDAYVASLQAAIDAAPK